MAILDSSLLLSPHEAAEHIRKIASSEGLGSISICECGTLSLNIQAMSVRLDLKAFAQLLMMCSEAMDELEVMAKRVANDANVQPVCPVASTLVH